MAKWFKEFPINLRTGTDRAGKTGPVGTKSTGFKTGHSTGGGVGSLLSGKHRKNSATELSRAGVSSWDNLRTKSRKNSKADPVFEEQSRATKSSPAANPFMNRLIRVDKPDKSPKFSTGTSSSPPGPEPEKPVQSRTEPLIILEDYADPFDAQKTREQREAERLDDNDGYMEPYDAQQMITEIRRRGSKDLLKVCVVLEAGEASPEDSQPSQIYDVPYEDDKMAVTRPDLDPRPATEYELPWEWKKDHLVRTLSAQFDSAERQTKDEAPHPTLNRHLRHKSWTPKILRSSTSSTNHETEPCCVDPSLPLEQQSWYHGSVTRQEAEFQLQSCREASFLVRISESDTSKYSIALKTSQGCVHIIVAQTRGSGFTLDQSSCVFPSIPEVVHHYCTQRLPFNGAEHMTLLHPVPRVH